MKTSVLRVLCSIWLQHSLIGAAAAQQAPVPSQTGDASQEQAIELSPFVVNSDQDVGYLASNTLAGSRLNTSLKDTAASISVFTSEFLSDIGAFDISEAMNYGVNIEYQRDDDRATTPNGNETVGGYQGYRIRGLTASIAQNYFNWTIPAETALIERIEDSRGPNSVLFGIASPGGLINSMTKQAMTGRSFQKASVSAGSYESWRGTLDVNRVFLDKRLAFRLNSVWNKTKTFRHWQFQEHRRVHLAGKYIISDRTRVRAEFERGQINSNAPRSDNLLNSSDTWLLAGRPTFPTWPASATERAVAGINRNSTGATALRPVYFSDTGTALASRGEMITQDSVPSGTITETVLTGDITDPSINIGGPSQNRYQRFSALSAFFEHQFSRNTFLEVAYNHQLSLWDRMNPQVGTPQRLRGDPNQFRVDGSPNPYAGRLYLEGGWQRHLAKDQSDTGRAMFSSGRDIGKWGNYRFAALAEYEKSFDGDNGLEEFWVDAATGLPAYNPAAENGQNQVYWRTYLNERQWGDYYLRGPGGDKLLSNVREPISGRTLSTAWFPASSSAPGEVYSTRKAGMIAAQARYFNGRLILAGGLRRDDLDEYQQGRRRDPVTGAFTYARDPREAEQLPVWTHHVGRNKTFGVVYHPLSWLSLYYNRADNITLPANQLRLPDDGVPGNPIPVAPPKGKGEDIGVAVSLLENKIAARATYYSTKGVRQSTTAPSAIRSANTRIMQGLFDAGLVTQQELDSRNNVGGHGLFDHASEGWELQITANPTKNWRFQTNYAYLDAVEENLFREWVAWNTQMKEYLSRFNLSGVVTTTGGRTIQEEFDQYIEPALYDYTSNDGGTKMGSRRHKVSFFTRYNFSSGWLNGAYIGGGYRYQSKMYVGRSPVDRSILWTPSFWDADLLAGYALRHGLGKGRRVSFQLNVFNLFDDRDPLITRYQFVGGEKLIFRSVPVSPRTWRLSINFEF